jgi:hypothetical protein
MTAEPALDEKIVLVHRALDDAGVGHAFGGALALAYYAEPRATIDVDVNIFVPPRRAGRTLDVIGSLGVQMDRRAALADARRDGQLRVRWGRSPLDLFFAYDPFHTACEASRRLVPFGDTRIPILAPEHLIVCKAVFDRRKDWLDIEQMLFITARDLDVPEVLGWSVRIMGADDRRTRRLEDLLRSIVGVT